jgi:hypothetical protein
LGANSGLIDLELPTGKNTIKALYIETPDAVKATQGNQMPFLHAIKVNDVFVKDVAHAGGKYSSHVFSTKGYNPNHGADKLFDGSTGTYAQVGQSGGFMTVFFRPPLTDVSSFEVYNQYGGSDEYTYQLEGGKAVSGTLDSMNFPGWLSLTTNPENVVSAMYLSHQPGQQGAGYPFAFALRVNGKILQD